MRVGHVGWSRDLAIRRFVCSPSATCVPADGWSCRPLAHQALDVPRRPATSREVRLELPGCDASARGLYLHGGERPPHTRASGAAAPPAYCRFRYSLHQRGVMRPTLCLCLLLSTYEDIGCLRNVPVGPSGQRRAARLAADAFVIATSKLEKCVAASTEPGSPADETALACAQKLVVSLAVPAGHTEESQRFEVLVHSTEVRAASTAPSASRSEQAGHQLSVHMPS